MAKPTRQASLEKATQIKSTIVPIEHKPLRRPYIGESRPGSPKCDMSEQESKETGSEVQNSIPFACVHERAKFRSQTIRELTEDPEPEQSRKPRENRLKQLFEGKTAKPVVEKTPQYRPDAVAIKQMIKNHMQQWRPSAWEDDFSRNTLEDEPFENIVSPADLPLEAFYASEELSGFAESRLGREQLVKMIAADQFPIPNAPDREGYSPGYDGVYWMSGLVDYLKVLEVAKRYGVEPNSVLDFGCATGRALRHFAVQADCDDVWGTDINARHVRWLQEFMPQHVKPVFNHAIPSLPISDSSVDVITAFSVFTHIDTFETCWLAELNRILADGGLCYLTVHNEDTWDVLRDEVENTDNRLIQSIMKIDPEFAEKLTQPMPNQRTVYRFTDFGPYRAQVFHSNDYLQRVWGRFFKIREIIPCHHVRQTVVVLQK